MATGNQPPFEERRWEQEAAFRDREVLVKERDAQFRDRELAIKEREVALREGELSLKRDEHASASWRNPLVVAIMAATLAGLSNAVVAIVNGRFQRQLEDGRAEQSRVLEMIKTGDPDKAAKNLEFLVQSGLIADPARVASIEKYLAGRAPGSGAALPVQGAMLGGITGEDDAVPAENLSSQSVVGRSAEAVGQIRGSMDNGALTTCTGFLVSPDLVMTAGHCVDHLREATFYVGASSPLSEYRMVLPPVAVQNVPIGLNYALLKVEGTPGNKHGILSLSTEAPKLGQPLAVVLFRGTRRRLAVVGNDDCRVKALDDQHLFHLCDTGGGSSGAPVISAADGTVVGLHVRRSEKGGAAIRSDVLVGKVPPLHATTSATQ
ncbi:trypsin-like serine peptidase [Tahibacter amnicola]|uniref:Serine protease n=1 Tax=Tahibacter amnicola TaxID=2976241 RepID=A0ABY6BP13_9GAMM|nr:serine protease [Tahibacter amnicola]UXI70301.1 serine protease [Tahibacter amnicola]